MPRSASRTAIEVAASPSPATVLIADAHAPTRAGVRQALAGGRFKIVGEAASATTPDCLDASRVNRVHWSCESSIRASAGKAECESAGRLNFRSSG